MTPDGRSVDLDRPIPARIHGYALGGDANFTADRVDCDALHTVYPDSALVVRANRASPPALAQRGFNTRLRPCQPLQRRPAWGISGTT